MVGSGLSAQEAYEAVPQLADRGEKVLQNLRKRAREARALLEATAAPPKPAKPRAKKQKKPPAVLPKGKRLRTDQVDAISAQKVEKRQRRSDACTLSCGRRRHTERQSHTLGVVGAYVVVNFVICEHKFSMSATNCSTTIRLKSSSRVSRDRHPVWRARTVNVERLGCEHAAVSPLAVSASA
jgi:hypothetical protein